MPRATQPPPRQSLKKGVRAPLTLEDREFATQVFMAAGHRMERMEHQRRSLGREVRERMQAEAIHTNVSTLIAALDRSIAAAETSLTGPMSGGEAHLRN